MRLVVVTPPAPVVLLADAKAHLRVLGGHDDARIQLLIDAATAVLDGRQGILGRVLGATTFDLFLDSFTDLRYGSYFLPAKPLISVDQITYRSTAAGAEVVVDAATFNVFGVLDYSAPGVVTSPNGWPSLAVPHRDAVRIRFTAGYPVVAGRSSVPEPIKQAIMTDVMIQYDAPTGDDLKGLQSTYNRLLSGYRERKI